VSSPDAPTGNGLSEGDASFHAQPIEDFRQKPWEMTALHRFVSNLNPALGRVFRFLP